MPSTRSMSGMGMLLVPSTSATTSVSPVKSRVRLVILALLPSHDNTQDSTCACCLPLTVCLRLLMVNMRLREVLLIVIVVIKLTSDVVRECVCWCFVLFLQLLDGPENLPDIGNFVNDGFKVCDSGNKVLNQFCLTEELFKHLRLRQRFSASE